MPVLLHVNREHITDKRMTLLRFFIHRYWNGATLIVVLAHLEVGFASLTVGVIIPIYSQFGLLVSVEPKIAISPSLNMLSS